MHNIDLPATGAHIHEAPVGLAGPVVVPLAEPDSTGHSSDCVDVDKKVLREIRKSPEDYYINVHTAAYPAGARAA